MKVTYEMVRDCLRQHGPMTSSEVCGFIAGSSLRDVSSILNRMRRLAVKQVYIQSWTRQDSTDKRTYLKPIYALGSRYCAKKPPPMSNAQRLRAARKRNAELRQNIRNTPNSVFALGSLQIARQSPTRRVGHSE